MCTYLLTWNPGIFEWRNYKKQCVVSKSKKGLERTWTCGNRKNIIIGDNIYLI